MFSAMNTLDWIIAVLFIVGGIYGYSRGFISQLVSIIGLFLAYVTAYLFYDDIAPWVQHTVPLTSFAAYQKYQIVLKGIDLDQYLYNAIGFILIFLGTKISLTVLGHFLNIFSKLPGIHMANKWSGAMLALVEVLLLLIIAVNVLEYLPSEQVQKLLDQSQAVSFFSDHVPSFVEGITFTPR